MSVPNAPASFRYAKKSPVKDAHKQELKKELALKPYLALSLFKSATSSLPRDLKSSEALSETQRAIARSIYGPDLRGADFYRVRLPLGAVVLTPISTVIASVIGVQSTSVVGFSEWAAVFSQYRITEAEVIYMPYDEAFTPTATVLAAGIDYGTNVTAAASFNAAQQYDDMKIINIQRPARWHVSVAKGRGATDFIDVATNLVYATWKCYNNVAVSYSIGVVCGYITLEFKGLQ